jgi:hypothetical protein
MQPCLVLCRTGEGAAGDRGGMVAAIEVVWAFPAFSGVP